MTNSNKQQALEELMAVMGKWDIEILMNTNNTVVVEIGDEILTSEHNVYGINAAILNNELNRMKGDAK